MGNPFSNPFSQKTQYFSGSNGNVWSYTPQKFYSNPGNIGALAGTLIPGVGTGMGRLGGWLFGKATGLGQGTYADLGQLKTPGEPNPQAPSMNSITSGNWWDGLPVLPQFNTPANFSGSTSYDPTAPGGYTYQTPSPISNFGSQPISSGMPNNPGAFVNGQPPQNPQAPIANTPYSDLSGYVTPGAQPAGVGGSLPANNQTQPNSFGYPTSGYGSWGVGGFQGTGNGIIDSQFGATARAAGFDVGGGGTGGGVFGSGWGCFSGNMEIETPAGDIRFDLLPTGRKFKVYNGAGKVVNATLLIHEHNGKMIDLGERKLSTLGHHFAKGDDYIPARDFFPDNPREHFKGKVYNLHVFDPAHNYRIVVDGKTYIVHNLLKWLPPEKG